MALPDDPHADDYNPFQAPSTPLDPMGVGGTDAELIRREHLTHEASVKSVGTLYAIGGVVCLVAAIVPVFVLRNQGADHPELAIGGGIGAAMCLLATGLYSFQSWARYLTGVFSGIGLLAFPVGTIINGYILYLLFSAKGTMVFSDEYHQVIGQTPHIKCQISIIVKVLYVLLLVVLGGIFLAMLFVG